LAKVLTQAMAQNRDQRYPTAADMTNALHTIGEATLSFEKTEAQTILVAPPTQVAAGPGPTVPGARKATIVTGETTVVRSPSAKRSRVPWAIMAGVVFLLAAGVFYAYQKRNSVSVPSPSPTPINKVEVIASPEPVNTPQQSSRPVEESKAQAELDPVSPTEQTRKKESLTRNKTATTRKRPIVDEAQIPKFEVPEVRPEDFPNAVNQGAHPPLTPRQQRRRGGDVEIRMEDGTVLRTRPDGTRIIITPDGTRRVIPPRLRMQRRRS